MLGHTCVVQWPWLSAQKLLDASHILGRIHSNGIEDGLPYEYPHPVLQKPQLFQPLSFLQRGFRPANELLQRRFPVGIETQMLEVFWVGPVAIMRDCSPRKIQRSPATLAHYLHR